MEVRFDLAHEHIYLLATLQLMAGCYRLDCSICACGVHFKLTSVGLLPSDPHFILNMNYAHS